MTLLVFSPLRHSIPYTRASCRRGETARLRRKSCDRNADRRMDNPNSVIKVAAVQAASVFLDRAGSTEKACHLIREAGRNGARVIGFPEGFIPAHPVWYHHHSATGALSNRLAVELFKNAVEIPGPQTEELARA